MRAETRTIRFLYGTMAGRGLLKILTRPLFSKCAGVLLNSRLSGRLVPLFIRKHHIDMGGYEDVGYRSFNDFFTRKRCKQQLDITPGHLTSPGDGYLSVYPVDGNRIYHVKQMKYRLEQLLKSRSLAEQFSGGLCLVLRLTPQDYHRYCYVCSGIEQDLRVIRGKLHCVRPIAYTSVPVFVENSREYTVISSPQFGKVVQMEIGALLVGKIHNYRREGRIWQGMEKGYFEFGGSTILVLIQKGRVNVERKIMENAEKGVETRVHMGEMLGSAIKDGEVKYE